MWRVDIPKTRLSTRYYRILRSSLRLTLARFSLLHVLLPKLIPVPTPPCAQYQESIDRVNILEAAGKGRGGVLGFFDSVYNNKVLFWKLIAGISVMVFILIVGFLYFWYPTHKEGKTLSEGCTACCDKCKLNCKTCCDKLACTTCCETFCSCFKSKR